MREQQAPLTRYQAFRGTAASGAQVVTLLRAQDVAAQRAQGLLEPDAVLLWEIDAATYEEAMCIHHLRLGFAPYQPLGAASNCPHCQQALVYAQGSGQCWRCGKAS